DLGPLFGFAKGIKGEMSLAHLPVNGGANYDAATQPARRFVWVSGTEIVLPSYAFHAIVKIRSDPMFVTWWELYLEWELEPLQVELGSHIYGRHKQATRPSSPMVERSRLATFGAPAEVSSFYTFHLSGIQAQGRSTMPKETHYTVVVIGTGFGGTMTALPM